MKNLGRLFFLFCFLSVVYYNTIRRSMITLIWEQVGKFSNAACATSFIRHSQCTALSGQFYRYLSLQYLKYENNPIRKARAKRWLDTQWTRHQVVKNLSNLLEMSHSNRHLHVLYLRLEYLLSNE